MIICFYYVALWITYSGGSRIPQTSMEHLLKTICMYVIELNTLFIFVHKHIGVSFICI